MVEGARLEIWFGGNSNVGSNPTLSAIKSWPSSIFEVQRKKMSSFRPVSRVLARELNARFSSLPRSARQLRFFSGRGCRSGVSKIIEDMICPTGSH